MAWEQVKVKGSKGDIPAMINGDVLEVANQLGKDPSEVKVDGKSYKVLSSSVDERDDIITIKLAMASTNKEKSDDKPTKGRD
tara:strand:- start:6720 stop:6965 length:246 start_codon:yes stop_codon:yes gene_type:complete